MVQGEGEIQEHVQCLGGMHEQVQGVRETQEQVQGMGGVHDQVQGMHEQVHVWKRCRNVSRLI